MLQKILLLPLLMLILSGYTWHKAVTAEPITQKGATINWISIEEAAEKIKKQPRKVVVDVYTDWCGWCKKMDKSTFTDPAVVAYINKNYYAVKLDAEGKKPITLNGHTYTFKEQYRAHELAVALLQGQMSYPTTVYLDEKFNMLTPVPGYLDANTFHQILTYFGDNHHKSKTWEEYTKK
ncbi:thioredoxin fold domain-containing protein [uncultured Pontibacter sp.]|uniref:thioredoxin family protein n=1 Tax=uncultured Pontibacter sp. TaxID=453356 RepID=UPI00262E9152|nr:thioredoxin fold domain-containing protein [uncultured Pontibacter sp.]